MAALKGKALIAYLIVCVFWGSTYLAIKVGVGELPPFLFAGLRFFIAGVLLLGIARAMGYTLPRRAVDWRTLAIVRLFLLTGGNALVAVFRSTVREWRKWQLPPMGAGAFCYLVVFGLIVVYVAFAYALTRTSASGVCTNACVNTFKVVRLGWLLLAEPTTTLTMVA